MRPRFAFVGIALVLAACTLSIGGPSHPGASAGPGESPTPVPTFGRVETVACHHRARCGTVTVPLDRGAPGGETIDIGFELHRHTDRDRPPLETIVATEGGPGYSTTDSRSYYLELFRPLLARHDLLLVDNRGTGTSGAIRCPGLQRMTFADYATTPQAFINAVGDCGRRLGPASGLYGTGYAADDLADVLTALRIHKVDLYGDSYGTFFGQAFALRHPRDLRTLILDGAYPVEGYDPWWRDTNRAIVDAFRAVCSRDAGCRALGGDPIERLGALVDRVRAKPIAGRAPNADGRVARVEVDPGTLADMAASAAVSPTVYRELDAAVRAATRPHDPDRRPLLRIVRENIDPGDSGAVRSYSQGLADAVSCNDYGQLYDMTASADERAAQYREAVAKLARDEPDSFAPFSVAEWTTEPTEEYDSCLEWPVPVHPAPPLPRNHTYPDTPVLVLNGDLDSLTSSEGAATVASRFPNSTFVKVANATHVTALEDPDHCASAIVLRFVRTGGDAGDTSCARRIAPIRVVDAFPRRAAGVEAASRALRTALVGVNTAADVWARWWSMYTYRGVGLRGGRFSTAGWFHVTWDLHGVRWVGDVPVDGHMTWDRITGAITADLRLGGSLPGRVRARWNDRVPHARALTRVTAGGRTVRLVVPAA